LPVSAGDRQRIVFLLVEDETGMTNVIVRPDVYDRCRAAVRGEPFLLFVANSPRMMEL